MAQSVASHRQSSFFRLEVHRLLWCVTVLILLLFILSPAPAHSSAPLAWYGTERSSSPSRAAFLFPPFLAGIERTDGWAVPFRRSRISIAAAAASLRHSDHNMEENPFDPHPTNVNPPPHTAHTKDVDHGNGKEALHHTADAEAETLWSSTSSSSAPLELERDAVGVQDMRGMMVKDGSLSPIQDHSTRLEIAVNSTGAPDSTSNTLPLTSSDSPAAPHLDIPEGSYFPEGYGPFPDFDYLVPDETVDPIEYIYSPEYIREDLLHTPFPYSLGFQSFAGLYISNFVTKGVVVGECEREALIRDTLKHPQMLETPQQPYSVPPILPHKMNQTDVEAMRNRTHLIPIPDPLTEPVSVPGAVLYRMIRGDGSITPLNMKLFADRYVVQQMDPGIFRRTVCDTFIHLMHLPDRPPLVISLFNLSPGKFALRCLYYRTRQLLTAKRRFVILAAEGDYAAAVSFFVDPDLWDFPIVNLTYLLNHPLLAHWYGVNGNINHKNFTPVPIGYRFFHRVDRSLMPLSTERRVDDERQHLLFTELILKNLHLRAMFPHIPHALELGRGGCTRLEDALDTFADRTVDPPIEWIPLNQLPNRITTIYIVMMPLQGDPHTPRPSLTNEVLIFHMEPGNIATANSQHIALLPFTAAVYHKLMQHPYGDPQERQPKLVSAFSVWEWREPLNLYLHNHTDFVVFPGGGQKDFFRSLNHNAFVISPIGYGYDCYRTWEALVFGAIPILQHPDPFLWKINAPGTFGELHYQNAHPEINSKQLLKVFEDLPVIVIYNNTQLTRENLVKWQKSIYEKFKKGQFRLEKLFMQHWIDMIYGHSND